MVLACMLESVVIATCLETGWLTYCIRDNVQEQRSKMADQGLRTVVEELLARPELARGTRQRHERGATLGPLGGCRTVAGHKASTHE